MQLVKKKQKQEPSLLGCIPERLVLKLEPLEPRIMLSGAAAWAEEEVRGQTPEVRGQMSEVSEDMSLVGSAHVGRVSEVRGPLAQAAQAQRAAEALLPEVSDQRSATSGQRSVVWREKSAVRCQRSAGRRKSSEFRAQSSARKGYWWQVPLRLQLSSEH